MTHLHEQDHKEEPREITIETLSTPPMKIQRAPLLRRVVAGAVDSIILLLTWAAFLIGFGEQISLDVAVINWTLLAYLVILTTAYYLLAEWLLSTTIGKSLLKLRVLEKNGDPCSFAASFKRNLARIIDWMPAFYVLGLLSIATSADHLRFGDRIAGTIVTRAPEKDANPPPAPFLFH